jgi:hypothetical protein
MWCGFLGDENGVVLDNANVEEAKLNEFTTRLQQEQQHEITTTSKRIEKEQILVMAFLQIVFPSRRKMN